MNIPESVHFGDNDLPFVDIGDGSKLKVLQVKVGEPVYIRSNSIHGFKQMPVRLLPAA